MKLTGYKEIVGTIRCQTGLRIGGSKDNLDIGGVDSPIIRHPITDLPYIPGSSIKGKIRTLLELSTGNISQDGKAHNCGNCEVCVFFGSLRTSTPTRFLFRDAPLTQEWETKLREAQEGKGLNFSELKNENWIDRRTGRAGQGGLRTFERVPADTEFQFNAVIRVFDGDNEQHGINFMKKGLKLLTRDYLGSSGSRGYGQIEFKDLYLDGKKFSLNEG
ncbi:MAG: CRISPR type III-associated RAMP protein Csm3 [Syntrophomonadaceae bacterium]|nr:CRISPR type III-associated RAMP protein Csm3 [Bacillota bacterium]